MDPQEQHPVKRAVPAHACPGDRLPRRLFRGSGVRGEFPVFTLHAERSVDRGQEQYHFSSGRVDVESFPARDTVPLRVVAIDLSTLESLQTPIGRASHRRASAIPIPLGSGTSEHHHERRFRAAILEKLDWSISTLPLTVPRKDPLFEMDTSN